MQKRIISYIIIFSLALFFLSCSDECCYGTGRCSTCGGSRLLECFICDGEKMVVVDLITVKELVPCSSCKGLGWDFCYSCKGTGKCTRCDGTDRYFGRNY